MDTPTQPQTHENPAETATVLNEAAVRAEWEAEGFSCRSCVLAKDQVQENFVHDDDLAFMLVEGRIVLEIDGRFFRPEPKEKLIISKRVKYSLRNVGSCRAKFLYGHPPLHS